MNDSQWHNSNSSTSENEMTKASDAENVNKQTLNEIATIIKTTQSSEAEQANEIMTEEFRHAANQPPLKIPMCYSVNQIEVLQTLNNFTFASQYETDEFMQKIVALLKKPDSTKIYRLPTPWREKFRCLSLDPNDFIYMDERLVIPKALRQIIIRSLHYGHLNNTKKSSLTFQFSKLLPKKLYSSRSFTIWSCLKYSTLPFHLQRGEYGRA